MRSLPGVRVTTRDDHWSDRRLRWSFWLCNVGLALMLFLSLLPVGFLQLETAFTDGYAASRSLEFYNSGTSLPTESSASVTRSSPSIRSATTTDATFGVRSVPFESIRSRSCQSATNYRHRRSQNG